MSEIEERTNKMRSIVIHAEDGKSAVDLLKSTVVDGWEWSNTDFPAGAAQHCMRKGQEFVAIRSESSKSSRATSSNVMPHDANHDPEAANKLIKELSDALSGAGIDNAVVASVDDLNS